MSEAEKREGFESWVVLELMGHRRLAGLVSEQEIAGKNLLRIDVPDPNGGTKITQFYGADAVYCMTPVSEATARAAAAGMDPRPVQVWELPGPAVQPHPDEDEEDGEFDL